MQGAFGVSAWVVDVSAALLRVIATSVDKPH